MLYVWATLQLRPREEFLDIPHFFRSQLGHSPDSLTGVGFVLAYVPCDPRMCFTVTMIPPSVHPFLVCVLMGVFSAVPGFALVCSMPLVMSCVMTRVLDLAHLVFPRVVCPVCFSLGLSCFLVPFDVWRLFLWSLVHCQ